MAKKKAIMRKVLTCFIIFAILASVMPVPVFAMNSSNNATEASNHSNDLEKSFILPLVSNDTRETVSALSCDVYVKIDDGTCVGYEVYVDGVYQFTEGQSGTPDGYCAFYVSAGTHKFELRKNGCTTSKSWYCQCGTVYIWVSMPDYWCEDGNGNCDNPPTVNFDKSTYYEGDTVHASVSTHHVSVYYEIKDCSGMIRESGHVSNGETISYTIPSSASECCYCEICFYWDVDDYPATINSMARSTAECSKCYTFEVCPKTTCEVWVEVVDKYCNGYDLYVDGVYQFTEGQDGTPDGYCSFHVTQGTHKFELRKNGCSVSKSWYCQCDTDYSWVSMNDMDPHWCDSYQQKKEVTFSGMVTGLGPYVMGSKEWYVSVDEWISGSLPCNEIDVAIGIYPPMGHWDENINKGDSVEVYGVVDPRGGSECTVGLNGESYYIKKASSNSPPTLTEGNVNGETLYHCDTATQLIFSVTYSDPDNDDPEYVKLKIGDSFYDMAKVDPGDNDYTDGCVYTYSTIMSSGKYFFTFSTSDGNHIVSIEPDLSCPFRDNTYLDAYFVVGRDVYTGGGNFTKDDLLDIINYYLCNYSCADCAHMQEILGRALQYVPEENKTLGAA
ncbi:MAG: hypothetical protein KAT65_20340, partial [Methanophagales archaeon]|nr:hypothetical protein [Methanophagales archaeon]